MSMIGYSLIESMWPDASPGTANITWPQGTAIVISISLIGWGILGISMHQRYVTPLPVDNQYGKSIKLRQCVCVQTSHLSS